jgi:hypothetical protein
LLWRIAAPWAAQALHHISQQCIPPRQRREPLRLRRARVAALVFELDGNVPLALSAMRGPRIAAWLARLR